MTWYRVFLLFAALASPVYGQLLSETDPSIPGNPPKLEVGITTCDDGTRWHAFTFQTIAGLPYVVESGNDLTGWEEEDSIYGFGQEEVVLMKQAPPLPAPPPPGTIKRTPPPMVRVPSAQIIMRRGTTGGLVLSWKSLDDGSPKVFFLPGLTQDPGWINMPGYVRRFNDFDFYLCNPLLPQVPPLANPSLGEKDSAMVAAFEESFPTMNADVAAAVVRARSAPRIPAPPTERRFWRVRVDWSLDSDLDGTPDWMEFAQLLAAGEGNNPVAGPDPDPFNKDTNGDGIPDGKQRSSDGDGIADFLDADKTDEVVNWEKTASYRYALFPLISTANDTAIQVDALGDVLLSDSRVFRRGRIESFSTTTNDIANSTASWLDDTGRAFGPGYLKLSETEWGNCVVSWAPDSLSPSALAVGAVYPQMKGNQEAMLADMRVTSLVDGSRSFIADAVTPRAVNGQLDLRPVNAPENSSYLWTLSDGLGTNPPTLSKANAVTGPDEIAVAHDGSLISINSTTLVSGRDLGSVSYQRVARLPSNDLIAFSYSLPPLFLHDGEWKKSKTLTQACVDASAETGFIFLSDGRTWLNGQIFSPYDVVPNLPFESSRNFLWYDAAPSGFALATHSTATMSGGTASIHCLAVPVKVEQGVATEAIPFNGVDDVSVTAEKKGLSAAPTQFSNNYDKPDPNGWLNKVWIMAPTDSDPSNPNQGTSAEISIPAMAPGTSFKLLPKSSRVTVTPDQFTPGSYEVIRLTATAGTSLDTGLKLEMGHTAAQGEQATTPKASENIVVGVKIMKKRTVKVALHPMILRKAGQNDNSPDLFPAFSQAQKKATKEKVESRLNEIYGPQTNTFFNVTVLDPAYADYDQRGLSDVGLGFLSPVDEEEVNAASPGRLSPSALANIDIWALGGVTLTPSGKAPIVGNVEKEEQIIGFRFLPPKGSKDDNRDPRIILNGDLGNLPTGNHLEPEEAMKIMLDALAHEIGHIMIGPGHPDGIDPVGGFRGKGPAELPGTRQELRLMFSSASLVGGSTQLVKAEWDKIEAWLKKEEDDGYL